MVDLMVWAGCFVSSWLCILFYFIWVCLWRELFCVIRLWLDFWSLQMDRKCLFVYCCLLSVSPCLMIIMMNLFRCISWVVSVILFIEITFDQWMSLMDPYYFSYLLEPFWSRRFLYVKFFCVLGLYCFILPYLWVVVIFASRGLRWLVIDVLSLYVPWCGKYFGFIILKGLYGTL